MEVKALDSKQNALFNSDAVLNQILDKLSKKYGELITISVFVPDIAGIDSGYLLSHSKQDKADLVRTDQYVHFRKFNTDQSIALEALYSNKDHGPSKQFPDKHYCFHYKTVLENGSPIVIQAVCDPKILNKTDAFLFDFHSACMEHDLSSTYEFFSPMPTQSYFNQFLRRPYQENCVLVLTDINDFKGISNTYGYQRANRMADLFVSDFIENIADEYNATILRKEGDGVWMAFFFNPDTTGARDDAISRAYKLSDTIKQKFSTFINRTDYRLQGASVKTAFELGELTPSIYDGMFSSSLFTKVKETAEKSDKKQSNVSIGQNASQYIQDYSKPSLKRFWFFGKT